MTSVESNERIDLAYALSSSWMAKNSDFNPPSEEKIAEIKERWDKAVSLARFAKDTSSRWWKRIVDLYSARDRAYHTLVHIKEMLGYVELLGYSDNVAMVLSVFFHDAIYNPKSSCNEEDSAQLFHEFCREAGPVEDHSLEHTVVQYILATKAHKLPDEAQPDECLSLFLDIDMAVLGKEEKAYLQYAAVVRREYHFVDKGLYCRKRAQILGKFLQESRIYLSKSMWEALEDSARTNLRKEIELLEAGVIPCELNST
jgi:predicted metal-dependent HD superfamily phosphohydrolase